VATGTDGETGAVANSGWQSSPSWTVPAGVLRDGVTYSWRVFTHDGKGIRNPDWVRTFKVDQRLGAGGPSPMDAAGPVGVNLATGNVTTSVGTPTVATVGGGIGVSFTYNSQAADGSGLLGSYYQDWNQNRAFDSGELWNTRVDPQVSFNFGTDGPMPGMGTDDYLARWSGFITMPTTGTYTLGTRSDDGVRVYLDGGNLWRDDWNGQAMAAGPEWANWGVGFTADAPRALQVDYFEGTGAAGIELWVKDPAGQEYIVPAEWLSTTLPGVPDGWTMSAGAGGGATYSQARVSASAVTLVASDASTWEYRRTGSGATAGFTPPAGNDDVLAQSADGRLVVQADDGHTYTFRSDGLLESVTSALDDRQPAAVTYTYTGFPARLSAITDPVSGRSVTLSYGGGSCPAPPPGAAPAPPSMLCRIDFSAFDVSPGSGGDATDLVYDSAGRLVRVVNPGGVTTDFAYDSAGRLTTVRDPLAGDVVAAGLRADDATVRTLVSYDTAGRAATVTLPEPSAGAARPGRSIDYTSGTETRVHTAGLAETAPNLWARRVTFDTAARTLTDTDGTGRTASTAWDAPDRPLRVTDAAGRVATSVYDHAGRRTDSYGPAPAACFTGQSPNGTCPAVPHSSVVYDGGINGLGVAYWNNKNLSGAPVGHGTDLADQIKRHWFAAKPDSSVTATEWSARYTGEITLATVGTYSFYTWAISGMRVWIDDRLLIDSWTDHAGWTRSPGPDPTVANTVAGAKHRIRIDVFDANNDAAAELFMTPPGGSGGFVPGSVLGPRYGLVTTATTADDSGVPDAVTTTGYTSPHLGLATSQVVDPAGLALTSTTSFEPVGSGYLRRTAWTLPAGAGSANTDTYYAAADTADDPCTTGIVEAHPQGGALRLATAADPDGAGPEVAVVREQRYDPAGRVLAARIGSEPWTCTSYDSRGRPTSVAYPAFGGAPARTVTSDHAVGGNPLVASVSDAAGTITTTVDLLGRVVAYSDVWAKTTTTSYDQVGRVTQTVGPAGTLAYTHDQAGRIETVHLDGAVVADPSYDAAGELGSVSYPAGVGNAGNGTSLTSIGRDPAGRLTGLTWGLANSVTVSDAVTRSRSGKVIDQSIDGTDPHPAGANYLYDAAGRLVEARVPGHTYTYAFAPSGGCGTAAAAGRNTNRTSLTVDGGTPVSYCYDHADRLSATTAAGYTGSISYDTHGNTVELAGETRGYDAADRHLTTAKGATTVTYTRDATDRIVARNDSTTTVKYSGPAVLDSSGAVIERTIPLPGGVLLTKRTGGDVWSYPNIHGDVIATADAAGAKQGGTLHWGPYGETLTAVPDNSAGAFDHGWLGQHQRPLEHEAGLVATIEMGARQYDPVLGRFLEIDPVEGGSCNDYDYVCGEPVNLRDLDGTRLCVDLDCKVTMTNKVAYGGKKTLMARYRTMVRAHQYTKSRSAARDPGGRIGDGKPGGVLAWVSEHWRGSLQVAAIGGAGACIFISGGTLATLCVRGGYAIATASIAASAHDNLGGGQACPYNFIRDAILNSAAATYGPLTAGAATQAGVSGLNNGVGAGGSIIGTVLGTQGGCR
jgi:RHS repeat-associated protein